MADQRWSPDSGEVGRKSCKLDSDIGGDVAVVRRSGTVGAMQEINGDIGERRPGLGGKIGCLSSQGRGRRVEEEERGAELKTGDRQGS